MPVADYAASGGKARAAKLTPEARAASARAAALARWQQRKPAREPVIRPEPKTLPDIELEDEVDPHLGAL